MPTQIAEWKDYRLVDRKTEGDSVQIVLPPECLVKTDYSRYVLETCHKDSLGNDCWTVLFEFQRRETVAERELFQALVNLALDDQEINESCEESDDSAAIPDNFLSLGVEEELRRILQRIDVIEKRVNMICGLTSIK
jgi:hypothetical protein